MEPSLFTRIIAGEAPASFVAKGDLWVAFLDIFPRRPGHTLVVPIEQRRRLSELSAESRSALLDGVVEAQSRLSRVFGVEDFSIVVHDGPMAGQEVPHVHVHVLPRSSGDGGRGLMSMWPDAPRPGGDPDHNALAELAARLTTVPSSSIPNDPSADPPASE